MVKLRVVAKRTLAFVLMFGTIIGIMANDLVKESHMRWPAAVGAAVLVIAMTLAFIAFCMWLALSD
jgi:hypothetical protein